MQVELTERTGKKRNALVRESDKGDLIELSKWKFDWVDFYESGDNRIFQVLTEEIEGLMKIEFVGPEFFEMKNIEVAPSNYGAQGRYTDVAKILISYGCLLAFELNKGPYQGYLSFVSKGKLIDYYIQEYNAELAFREQMFISPSNGIKLIRKYLNINL